MRNTQHKGHRPRRYNERRQIKMPRLEYPIHLSLTFESDDTRRWAGPLPYHGRLARADGLAVEKLRYSESQSTLHGRDARDTTWWLEDPGACMRLFVIAIIASVAVLAQGASIARAQATKPAASWNNVTHNAGGDKWGYAGVTYMAAVPGTDEIIAGVSEAGLWSTRDRGKIWTKLGGKDATQIQNRPY